MLSKSSHSFTPSPYGYSPCPGESADDHVECIHSVKPTALSPGQGDEHEVRRGWRVNWTTAILLPKIIKGSIYANSNLDEEKL